MLDEVSLDFDGDLGGLKKGARPSPPRLHPAWIWTALSIPILLVWAHPPFGLGAICGVAFGVAGMLVWDANHT